MNASYAGTAELNYAFRRRFGVVITMGYLSRAQERDLIIDRSGLDIETADKLVKIGADTRRQESEGKLNHSASTAHLLEFAEMLKLGTFTAMDCARVTLNLDDDEGATQDVLNVVRNYF
jgi:MoxR-like ATPase